MSFPSIWEAEARHKDGAEDRATSRLFGYLGRLPKETRQEFLSKIRLEPTDRKEELESIKLWFSVESEDGDEREIDAVLRYGSRTLLVEVKLGSSLRGSAGVEQITEEYIFSLGKLPNPEIFVITADDTRPAAIREAIANLKRDVRWIRWLDCLTVAEGLLEEGAYDDLAKRDLTDLIEYLREWKITTHGGFVSDVDWDVFGATEIGVRKLKKAVGMELKDRKFDTLENHSHDDGKSINGLWVYSTTGSNGERGFWFGIGSIKGKNQIEFAAYEESKRNQLSSLKDAGFIRWYPVDSDGWKTKNGESLYVAYSKFLPIANLKGKIYEDQEKEILDFVRTCRAEVKLN